MTYRQGLMYAGLAVDFYVYFLAWLKLLETYCKYLDKLNAKYPMKEAGTCGKH